MELRARLRKIVLDILGITARPKSGIHILNGHMLHRLCPDEEAREMFEVLLATLKEWVTYVRIEDAVRMICRHEQPDMPLVAFTFDDGFEECFTGIAPVLEKFGINGMFFINPGFVTGDEGYIKNFTEHVVLTPGKRPMNWEQIADLQRRGHIIGAHTMDHYMINDSDLTKLDYQIGFCKSVIEQKLKVPCDYFAFPCGRLEHANPAAIEIATRYYKYVFSQSDYKHYFSFGGKVINRRHFEPFWPVNHVRYFLSSRKTY